MANANPARSIIAIWDTQFSDELKARFRRSTIPEIAPHALVFFQQPRKAPGDALALAELTISGDVIIAGVFFEAFEEPYTITVAVGGIDDPDDAHAFVVSRCGGDPPVRKRDLDHWSCGHKTRKPPACPECDRELRATLIELSKRATLAGERADKAARRLARERKVNRWAIDQAERNSRLQAAGGPPITADGVGYGDGCRAIMHERSRQLSTKQYTVEHDDAHRKDAGLRFMAAWYLAQAHNELIVQTQVSVVHLNRPYWNDGPDLSKPHSPRGYLVKAGALIAAEIDRLDRERAAELTSLARGRGVQAQAGAVSLDGHGEGAFPDGEVVELTGTTSAEAAHALSNQVREAERERRAAEP